MNENPDKRPNSTLEKKQVIHSVSHAAYLLPQHSGGMITPLAFGTSGNYATNVKLQPVSHNPKVATTISATPPKTTMSGVIPDLSNKPPSNHFVLSNPNQSSNMHFTAATAVEKKIATASFVSLPMACPQQGNGAATKQSLPPLGKPHFVDNQVIRFTSKEPMKSVNGTSPMSTAPKTHRPMTPVMPFPMKPFSNASEVVPKPQPHSIVISHSVIPISAASSQPRQMMGTLPTISSIKNTPSTCVQVQTSVFNPVTVTSSIKPDPVMLSKTVVSPNPNSFSSSGFNKHPPEEKVSFCTVATVARSSFATTGANSSCSDSSSTCGSSTGQPLILRKRMANPINVLSVPEPPTKQPVSVFTPCSTVAKVIDEPSSTIKVSISTSNSHLSQSEIQQQTCAESPILSPGENAMADRKNISSTSSTDTAPENEYPVVVPSGTSMVSSLSGLDNSVTRGANSPPKQISPSLSEGHIASLAVPSPSSAATVAQSLTSIPRKKPRKQQLQLQASSGQRTGSSSASNSPGVTPIHPTSSSVQQLIVASANGSTTAPLDSPGIPTTEAALPTPITEPSTTKQAPSIEVPKQCPSIPFAEKPEEFVDEDGTKWLKPGIPHTRPKISYLIASHYQYKTWNSTAAHFKKYSEFRTRDERTKTVSEICCADSHAPSTSSNGLSISSSLALFLSMRNHPPTTSGKTAKILASAWKLKKVHSNLNEMISSTEDISSHLDDLIEWTEASCGVKPEPVSSADTDGSPLSRTEISPPPTPPVPPPATTLCCPETRLALKKAQLSYQTSLKRLQTDATSLTSRLSDGLRHHSPLARSIIRKHLRSKNTNLESGSINSHRHFSSHMSSLSRKGRTSAVSKKTK